jgi:NADPH2:quinone reductase
MRVVQFTEFGDVSRLHLAERPVPSAHEGTAVVQIDAASVNPSDVKNIAGRMSQTTLPRVSGRDYSGVVVDGPAAWMGQEVWGSGGDVGFTRDGTHAEYIEVPVSSLAHKPACLTHDQAACIGVNFVTAWCAMSEYAHVSKGETVAVFGSTGGVGGAAVQIAKHAGARIISIGRSQPHPSSRVAELADFHVDSSDPKLVEKVRSLTHQKGVDVVLNAAGGPMFEIGLGILAHRGRQVEITSPTERRVSFDLVDFYHNESQLFGVDTLKRDLTAAARILESLKPGFDSGAYHPPAISETIPLHKVHHAFNLVHQGSNGRVVLKPHHKN